MIRMTPSKTAAHAKEYFRDALQKSDYYIDGQELMGVINGKLADRLGLNGYITQDIFYALCENRNPTDGKQLTLRTNEERITGYDFTFSCPKSVSIVHALSSDDHILKAFQDSVRTTMTAIEADAKTRVRKNGEHENRHTGELLWVDFVHQTSRPIDDHVPDPQLHSHCYIFNATYDQVEQCYKAGKFRNIVRDIPYYHALFHKKLADNLQRLGYSIRQTKNAFEIDGVPPEAIQLFSKRTTEISKIAKEKGITGAKQLDKLGAKTRGKKQKGLTMAELKQSWRSQIVNAGINTDGRGSEPLRQSFGRMLSTATPDKCIDHALKHLFERASVVPQRKIIQEAVRHSIGAPFISAEELAEKIKSNKKILTLTDGDRLMSTTMDVFKEEEQMVRLAKSGKGMITPLYARPPKIELDGQQLQAVRHILTTTDRVSIVRGAAGSGKTTLMKEAKRHINNAGKNIIVVAPTAEASRGVLRGEGFKGAETVASLLLNKELQKELKNQVLWVDEAGLLGTKDMVSLLKLAVDKNARLILGGDTRQHASVVRGDALRILNTVGGVKTAEVSKIYRQKGHYYRTAVEKLAEGKVAEGFKHLEQIDSFIAVHPDDPHSRLVNDYIASFRKKKSSLVICPTHAEGEILTTKIREKLRAQKKLGTKELSAHQYISLNLTDAQKADWRNYNVGQIINFNQNYRGVKRGSTWKVNEVSERAIGIRNRDGDTVWLPRSKANIFDVCEQREILLAKGDKIRITKNSFDKDKKRLDNGQTLEVVSVSKLGNITLTNMSSRRRFNLDKRFGYIAHAHCITSYASQGKTVDEVFIAQPSSTFGATDAKQFYVSVSRAREKATIYTDDKAELLKHASDLSERQSALEFVMKSDNPKHVARMEKHLQVQRQRQLQEERRTAVVKQMQKDHQIQKRDKEISYEPGA